MISWKLVKEAGIVVGVIIIVWVIIYIVASITQ